MTHMKDLMTGRSRAMQNFEGHTPGPWDAPRGGWYVYGPDGLPVAQSVSASLADCIEDKSLRAFSERSKRTEAEATENARLIAAAPTILEQRDRLADALEVLLSRIGDSPSMPTPGTVSEALEAARAVLAELDG